MRLMFRRISLLLLGAVLGASLTVAMSAVAQRYSYSLLRDLSLIAQIIEQVKVYYVDELASENLVEDAIEGIFEDLDPHSTYLDEEAISDLRNATSGEYVGLGIEVSIQNKQLVVVSPISGSPAAQAGLQAGDVIVAFDSVQVDPDHLDKTLDEMRGAKGEPALITVTRTGSSNPIDYRVIRDVIHVTSVEHKQLDNGYGYVRINTFQHNTARELKQALQSLQTTAIDGLIVDLRDNPGGVLSAAVDAADLFLDQGLIVSTRGRYRAANQEYWASNSVSLDQQLPVVVLINKGSASASEILAGALKDHRRATLAGHASFGKGSVQTLLPLPGFESALKLTTARYFTPSGASIHGKGIKPDIELKEDFVLNQNLSDLLSLVDQRTN